MFTGISMNILKCKLFKYYLKLLSLKSLKTMNDYETHLMPLKKVMAK